MTTKGSVLALIRPVSCTSSAFLTSCPTQDLFKKSLLGIGIFCLFSDCLEKLNAFFAHRKALHASAVILCLLLLRFI